METIAGTVRYVKINMSNTCYLAFETLEYVREFGLFLGRSAALQFQEEMSKLTQDLVLVGSTSLTEFADEMSVIGRSISIPTDGSVLQVVVESADKIKRFCEYPDVIIDLLSELRSSGWKRATVDNSTSRIPDWDQSNCIDVFVCDILDTLLNNIDVKARASAKRYALAGFVYTNNTFFLLRFVQELQTSKLTFGICLQRLEDHKKKASKMYFDG